MTQAKSQSELKAESDKINGLLQEWVSTPKIQGFITKPFAKIEFNDKTGIIREIKQEFLASKLGQEWLVFAIDKDPALKGKPDNEVEQEVLCYPGLTALATHLVAHEIYKQQRFADARHLSEAAHTLSGMDIHPGASISPKVFFDHCTGMVIGETASVGVESMFYHGVTLGGVGGRNEEVVDTVTGEHKMARHPQIGCNVIISLGTQVLGPSLVANNVRIGAKSQISNCTVGLGAVIGPGVQLNKVTVEDNTKVYATGQQVTLFTDEQIQQWQDSHDKTRDDAAKLIALFRAPKAYVTEKMAALYKGMVGSNGFVLGA